MSFLRCPRYKVCHLKTFSTEHKGSISGNCTKDNKDSNNIILNISNTFKNWDEVDDIVNKYAKHNGFVAIKFHKDLDPVNKNIVCWRAYKY
ncbi:6145_t:CDS:2 [Gigaspora margarita]|uniref:6145_t:CDS:1 n=1 Tax=Gigaspora margarita TaxID=4874 RepID=A0ABN7VZE7_GIGMA|nr:6145_t:CDS:2 [Gigaspora margarita]